MPVKVKKEIHVDGDDGFGGATEQIGDQDSGDRDAQAEVEEDASDYEDGGDDDGDEGDEGDQTKVDVNHLDGDARKFHAAFKLPLPEKRELSVQQLYSTYPYCINN
jgi:hypothetical protein